MEDPRIYQFIALAAHELKAPLGAVEGYINIIKSHAAGDDPEVYKQMLERSLVRLEGMRKLIDDLLDLSRIESGQRKRELTAVNLCEAAARAVEACSGEALKRNIKTSVDCGKPFEINADPTEIEIVFNNLVSNAVKYNRDGGNIYISLEQDRGQAIIKVMDTGIGMSSEEQGRLFGDFGRIKNEKTRNILGTGLGLVIVKKIVELYNGSIEVSSEEDKGTTVTVRI